MAPSWTNLERFISMFPKPRWMNTATCKYLSLESRARKWYYENRLLSRFLVVLFRHMPNALTYYYPLKDTQRTLYSTALRAKIHKMCHGHNMMSFHSSHICPFLCEKHQLRLNSPCGTSCTISKRGWAKLCSGLVFIRQRHLQINGKYHRRLNF